MWGGVLAVMAALNLTMVGGATGRLPVSAFVVHDGHFICETLFVRHSKRVFVVDGSKYKQINLSCFDSVNPTFLQSDVIQCNVVQSAVYICCNNQIVPRYIKEDGRRCGWKRIPNIKTNFDSLGLKISSPFITKFPPHENMDFALLIRFTLKARQVKGVHLHFWNLCLRRNISHTLLSLRGTNVSVRTSFDRSCLARNRLGLAFGLRSLILQRADLVPHRANLVFHRPKLVVGIVSGPLGLSGERGQPSDGLFYIPRIGGVQICKKGHTQGANADQKREPFAYSEAAKKGAGALVALLATFFGTIGAALLVGAQGGRVFQIGGWLRVRYAVVGCLLCATAAWIIYQWAAPLLA